jgi:L-threonylcarbamoyladenylate synthase
LRPGGIAVADLEAVLGRRLPPAGAPGGRGAQAGGAAPPRAPGGLPSHYAPRTPALWLEPAALDARARAEPRAAVLSRRPPPGGRAGPWRRLPADAVGYGRALYAALRELDAAGAPCILVEAVPATPAWLAVADRLRRATHGGGSDQRPANAPGAVAVADATP